MKKQISILTSMSLFFGSTSVFAEQRVKPGFSIYFEVKNKTQNPARIKIKDGETGKRANILLPPSKLYSGVAGDYFLLQFDNRGLLLDNLEFTQDDKVLKPFLPGPNKKNTYRVFLFPSENESKEFSERFYQDDNSDFYPAKPPEKNLDEGGKAGQKTSQAAAASVQPVKPVVVVTEVPKEIPKVEPLKTKSEEIQKHENEAKLNLEVIEAQKRAERLEQLAKMKEEEKLSRKKKAQQMANSALESYKKGDYKESVRLFSEATSLDPESDTFYFQYGVALYKTEKYKKALATLSMAEGEGENKIELNYFKALIHLKFEDYDLAYEEFSSVQDENDQRLSGAASFFAGSIAFRKENYNEARKHLEYTLDHSNDPKTDQQAEELIEEIDRIEAFIAKSKEIFRYSFTAGGGYDQNILNVAIQNNATSADAFRLSYGGSLLYRLIYDYRNELSTEININDMYSVNKSFEADPKVQTADPLVLSLGLPYHRQSILGKTSVTWSVTPQYQSIFMSLTGGSRSEILSSSVVKLDANFMLSSQWLSTYRTEYSLDKSGIVAASIDDDLSGNKVTMGTTQTRLLDQRGENTWNYSLEYTINNSNGKNYQFNKWALGLGYTDKFIQGHDGTLKIDYSSQNYPNASTVRTDNLMGLSASLGKEYWPSTYLTYLAQYNINSSNVSTYQYDKYAINVSLTYTGSKKKN